MSRDLWASFPEDVYGLRRKGEHPGVGEGLAIVTRASERSLRGVAAVAA